MFHCFVSASLSINTTERKRYWNKIKLSLPHLSGCLSVDLSESVRKVYCDKTVDWIRMSFRVVSGVGRGRGVLDRGGDRRRGRGTFGSEFGTSHCNQ